MDTKDLRTIAQLQKDLHRCEIILYLGGPLQNIACLFFLEKSREKEIMFVYCGLVVS